MRKAGLKTGLIATFFMFMFLFNSLVFAGQMRMGKLIDDSVGCVTKNYLYKAADYGGQGDTTAFMKLLLSENCRIFKKSEVVYVITAAPFANIVKIREKGCLKEYWILGSAISLL